MSTSRTSRSSRYSSPASQATSGAERQKAFMRSWLEPPVQSKPSFQEAGLERAGVVENMLPLGSLPKLSQKKGAMASLNANMGSSASSGQRLPGAAASMTTSQSGGSSSHSPSPSGGDNKSLPDEEAPPPQPSSAHHATTITSATPASATTLPSRPGTSPASSRAMHIPHQPRPARKIILKTPFSSAITVNPSSAALQPRATSPFSALRPPPPFSTPPQNHSYSFHTPTGDHLAGEMSRKSNRRHHPDDDSDAEYNPATSPSGPASRTTRTAASRSSTPLAAGGSRNGAKSTDTPSCHGVPNPAYLIEKDLEETIEHAVDVALEHHRYPTAYSIRTLYDENRKDGAFLDLLRNAFATNPETTAFQEFAQMLIARKKLGARNRTAIDYFLSSKETPGRPIPVSESDREMVPFDIRKLAGIESPGQDDHKHKRIRLTRSVPDSADESVDQHKAELKGRRSKHKSPSPRKKDAKSARAQQASLASDSSESELSDLDSEAEQELEKALLGSSSEDSPEVGQPIAGVDTLLTTHHKGPTHSEAPPTVPPSSRPRRGAKGTPSDNKDTPPPHPVFKEPRVKSLGAGKNTKPAATPPFASAVVDISDHAQDSDSVLSRSTIKVQNDLKTRSSTVESAIRPSLRLFPTLALPPRAQTPQPQPSRPPKRGRNEAEEPSSPFEPNPKRPARSTANSRAATPAMGSSKQRPPRALRTKQSPMKNRSGNITAGAPRRGAGGRSSPAILASDEVFPESDDFCASCGGAGNLLLCDGCTRVFHPLCLDPPLDSEQDLPDEPFYCESCTSKRNFILARPPPSRPGFRFGPLETVLDAQVPKSFQLPESIRSYFEDVQTGPDGEYATPQPPKLPKNKPKDYFDEPDYFRLTDSDGKPVVCHSCAEAAQPPDRQIITCIACRTHWHLDCLDPVLTHPPKLRLWKCPLHAEPSHPLAPAHKFRAIKGNPVIEPVFSRGIKNNGHIVVENDDDEEEAVQPVLRTFGHATKVKASAIKLDFISAIHRDRARGRQMKPDPFSCGRPLLYAGDDLAAAESLMKLSHSSVPPCIPGQALTELAQLVTPEIASIAMRFQSSQQVGPSEDESRALVQFVNSFINRLQSAAANPQPQAIDNSAPPTQSSLVASLGNGNKPNTNRGNLQSTGYEDKMMSDINMTGINDSIGANDASTAGRGKGCVTPELPSMFSPTTMAGLPSPEDEPSTGAPESRSAQSTPSNENKDDIIETSEAVDSPRTPKTNNFSLQDKMGAALGNGTLSQETATHVEIARDADEDMKID